MGEAVHSIKSRPMHRSKLQLYSITTSARDVIEYSNPSIIRAKLWSLPEMRGLGRRSCRTGAAQREGNGDALRFASVFWLTGKSTTITALGGIRETAVQCVNKVPDQWRVRCDLSLAVMDWR